MKFHNNKNDSNADWKSNALKIGVDCLTEPLCDLLQAFPVHGFIPKVFLVCTLIPIVKDNKSSKLTSGNYRLIAIGALLLKLFDKVLLELCCDDLKPSPYQFGFQKNMSTTMCSHPQFLKVIIVFLILLFISIWLYNRDGRITRVT